MFLKRKYLILITTLICFKYCHSQINTITGLELWISADSSYITSGNLVDTLYDLSINKNHAVQPNLTNKPQLFTSSLNGHKTLVFDAIDDFLSLPTIDFKTVFIVGKSNESPSSDYRGLLGGPNASTSIGGYLINTIPSSNLFALGVSSTSFNLMNKNGIATVPFGDFFPLNNYWIGTFEFVTNRSQTAEIGRIDAGASPGRYWDGEVAEIIVYKKALTLSEITIVETYLHDKYSPKVNIGNKSIKTNLCDTVIDAGHYYSNYIWSNGSTASKIHITNNGKYWVRVQDVFGKISSDTVFINRPILNQIHDSTYCSSISLEWNTFFSKADYSFQWQDNSNDSLILINGPGQYYVTISDGSGCNYKSNTITIIQDSFSTTASLGPDLIQCAGNSITLISGLSTSNTYTWSTGSTNDSLLINTSGQYSVIVTNTNNCVAKDTINVTIQGQAPVANFTTNIGCINSIVNFTDLSVPPSGNTLTAYEWNFGDLGSATNTSTLSNPSHTYTNTGTYTVSLKVISNAGCEQTIRKIIQVFPKPTVNFISGISCQNDSTAFSSLTTSTSGYSISSLNWNFGDPASGLFNTSSLTSPKHLFSNQSNYTIKLVAVNNVGCKDSLINIIAVRAQVKADFTISSPCANNATVFQDNSIVPPSPNTNIRTWNLGSGPVNGLSVSKTYTSSGVYYVTLTVNSSNQCSSSITKLITIYASPTVSFAIPAFCSKDTITATNLSVAQSGIITSTNWKLNSVNFSSIQNPTLSISNAGSYNVRLTVTNSFGCKDSITKAILVNPLPNADFTTNPTTYYYINSPVNFIPSITNASSYFWTLNSIGTSTAQSPSATYNAEGTYTVSLNLQDLQGCKNSVTKTLLVSKRFLDVAILNVNSTKDNDGFMTIQTDIANYGSIPVSTLDLSYKVSDGGNVQETWNGTLNPNSFFSYTFVSKTATQIGSSNNITCVDVKKANGINDQNQTNNELCNVLNTNDITVSNPIPNPTNADITLPIILNKEIDFSVSIYNSNGQIQYEEKTQKGIIGLNLITLPTANYARGCYIIKTVIDDKIFIKKFIKISNE